MDCNRCYECHGYFPIETTYVVGVVLPWSIVLCETCAERAEEIAERVKQRWDLTGKYQDEIEQQD
jgi:hypothetical protein